MKVVYIITKDRKRKDDSKIRGSIKEMCHLSENNVHNIPIGPTETDIELSEHEVGVDVTLRGTPSIAFHELKKIMLHQLFNTPSNEVEKHEATFYKGDEDRLHIHIGVRHIQQLRHIFSLLFSPNSRTTLESKLKGLKFEYKMKNSLKVFKDCVLQLNTLTDHQEEAFRRMKDCKRVLINGRAGSSKTFLAMHLMLGLLTDNSNISDSRVPFTTK